jgi:hypothetical protein
MTYSHTRGDSVWIDNHVRHYSFSCKWQVFLSVSHTASSLLSVTTSEFVSNLWNSNGSHFNFSKSKVFFVSSYDNLIDDTTLRMLQRYGAVLEPSHISLNSALIETSS